MRWHQRQTSASFTAAEEHHDRKAVTSPGEDGAAFVNRMHQRTNRRFFTLTKGHAGAR